MSIPEVDASGGIGADKRAAVVTAVVIADIEAGKEVKKLPMSLGEALDHLDNSEVVQRGLPGEMYRLYTEYKRDEYARFMSTVTDWDNETYMECLP